LGLAEIQPRERLPIVAKYSIAALLRKDRDLPLNSALLAISNHRLVAQEDERVFFRW
jgi:hypothetical protein